MRTVCLVIAFVLITACLHGFAADDYVIGPDSKPQEAVPKGKLEGPFEWKSKICQGTTRRYWVYVPAQYKSDMPACVMVYQDGHAYALPDGIFINPGNKEGEPPADGKNWGRATRSFKYDSLGDLYARFLVEEILPEVGKTYNLTKDPEGRAICGASSGAICAFTVAWERPDEFRKVICHIGSFTNLRGGHVYPKKIFDGEKKPIRIFIPDGTNDNLNARNPERDWFLQNQAMVAALKEREYDYKAVFGDGSHSQKHGAAIFPEQLRWLWRDYSPKPLEALTKRNGCSVSGLAFGRNSALWFCQQKGFVRPS
jgi:enterochelin esterase-like enzyme